MKIALIHGYAVGLQIDMFRPPFGYDVGFGAFRPLIDDGRAVVFRWTIPFRYPPYQVANPFVHLTVYNAEKSKAVSAGLHRELSEFLELEKPDTIVAHSMGTYLLHHYINTCGLPGYVRNIVFVQGDLADDFEITEPGVTDRLRSGKLKLYNYYCPWDVTLMSSMAINGHHPIGLGKIKHDYAINRFFPLYKKVNVHRSTMNDSNFVDEVLRLGGGKDGK